MCAFGKKPIFLRLLGGSSLILQSMFLGLFVRGLTHVLISTAPPMSGLAAQFIGIFRRIRIVYWVMDLNPDQMIVTGRLNERSVFARFSEWVNRVNLQRANSVVALDSFMAERLKHKVDLDCKLAVIPPWPYDNQLVDIKHGQNHFRKVHGLEDRFVVMYSGNITEVHPLDTLMAAILRLKDDDRFLFLFVGAESGRRSIDAFAADNKLKNIMTMSYVPLEETQYSLSAADLHVVTMGDNMVGIVHPCKVYSVMSVGRPFLAIGPKESHLGEILNTAPIGWLIGHGDVEGVVKALEQARSMSRDEWKRMGDRGRDLVEMKYSRKVLCGGFSELLE
jgi:glycosyltransferase involved in cell wall biosynthesis